MPSDDHINPQRYRVRVFVDFWNYTLSMRGVDEDFRTDWSSLGPVFVARRNRTCYRGGYW